jgi:hypothetical protein
MKLVKTILAALSAVLIISSCEKDEHIPPDVSLKTGAGYISADAIVPTDTTITVGFVADKTEDELKTFNVSYAYDGATTTTTAETFTLSGDEEEHYEKDYTITTRDVAGTERWIFTITDRDGNIAQEEIVLTTP